MAATTPAHAILRDRSAEVQGMTNRWTDIWSSVIVSRLAGLCALVYVAIGLVNLGGPYFSDLSAAQIVSWASQNQPSIWREAFIGGLLGTLLALLLVLLDALADNSRLLSSLTRVGAAAVLATGWAAAGLEYGLADLAHRGGADAGVLALFSLVKASTYTDGMAGGVATAAVCVLLLRARALPRPVLWLGLLLAAELIVAMPIQLAITGTGDGPQGFGAAILGLLWHVVIGITLLVKPVRLPEASTASTLGTV